MSPHKTPKITYTLIVCALCIIVFGMIMLTSASQIIGIDNFDDPYYYVKHQIVFGLLPGMVFLLLAMHMHYSVWKKIATPLFIVSLILLVLVLIPEFGFSHGGAQRWLTLGPITFQPSEIAKVTLVLFLSAWFCQKKGELNNFSYTFVPFLIYVMILIVLIALEPDIGTLATIITIACALAWTARMKLTHIFTFLLILGFSFLILIKAAPYRMARISTFLDPKADSQGIGYQINQSLLAIGSGGISGQGWGQSKQKYHYLPEVAGDSIFAVIAEELGFIFTTFFIILFSFFILLGYRIATHSKDPFAKYVASGITSWFGFQGIIHISSLINLLPLTGLTFPFISYGSSSLIASMAGLGILINISRFTKTP